MRLLITTPWPLRSPGGGQRLAHGIADAIAAQGIDVIVAAGTGLTELRYDVVDDSRFREVRVRLVGGQATRDLRRRSSADLSLEGLESLAEQVRPQALLFMPHYSSCARQSRAVAERLAIPFILWPAVHLDNDGHTSAAAKRFYLSADRVVCLSESERLWLTTAARVPPQRVLLCGYPWRGPVHASAPPRHPGRVVNLLSIGAFVRHKQFDQQIEALHRLRHRHRLDARLMLAGAAVQSTVLADLHGLARTLGLEGHVEFAVNASDVDIARLYAAADAFLFTSRSESFGVAVLEAIARATPPIVYPHPIYGELVRSARFGSVAVQPTPAALASAVPPAIERGTSSINAYRLGCLANHSPLQVGTALARMLDQLETERRASGA